MKFLRPLLAPLLLLGLWSVPPAAAAELIMLERPGCAWCLRWDREIAPIYPKTAEGHQAPLRRVDVTQPWPSDLAGIGGDIYTPTFIVVENGTEVARLRGYPGEHFFWPLLNEMLQRLPHLQPDSGPAADS
ncbi:MAG TPA: transcriptional regulator [Kiloniellaceae bacterium]